MEDALCQKMLRLQEIGAINIVNIDNSTPIIVATCLGKIRSPFETIELQLRYFDYPTRLAIRASSELK
jgi:hypothetical protein